MAESTNFPDPQAYLHTLRSYLQALGRDDIASLLLNSHYDLVTFSSFSGRGWDNYSALMQLSIPAANLAKITDEIHKALHYAIEATFPKNTGYDIVQVQLSALLEAPPTDEQGARNTASLVSRGYIEHDGLYFRSRSETRIYDALKKRNVLFFANATAVLGGKNLKREPDFLICSGGKWGILEVMGEEYHPSATAMRDHDRARLFKDYGLYYIEFYDAQRCYNKPDEVVEDFLRHLGKAYHPLH